MHESLGNEYQEPFPEGGEPLGQPMDLSIVRHQGGHETEGDTGEYALPITAGPHRNRRPVLSGDVAESAPYVEPPVASVTPASAMPEFSRLPDQGPADEALQLHGRLPADYDRKSHESEQGPKEPPAETGGGGGDGPTDNHPPRGGEVPDDPGDEDGSGDEDTPVHSPHPGRPIVEYDEIPAAQSAPESGASELSDTVPGTASDTPASNASPTETGGALPVLSPEAQAAMAEDTEFRDEPILEVTQLDDGRYEITTDKRTLSDGESEVHTSFAYEAVDGVPPEVGETARFYGEKWGEVRGLVVGGRVYRYTPAPSPEELAAERAATTFEAEAEETFNEADYDLRALQLPQPLQDNITAHKEKYPDFLTGGGMRGLVRASENVVRLVDALGGSAEALEAFTAMTYEQRLEAQPWLATGAHTERSRAILDYECGLAAWYLEQRDQEEQ